MDHPIEFRDVSTYDMDRRIDDIIEVLDNSDVTIKDHLQLYPSYLDRIRNKDLRELLLEYKKIRRR